MKKTLLVLALSVATLSVAFAQKPAEGEGKFSLEAQIGASFGGGMNIFSAPTVRMRYFFKDNMAIRLGVGVKVNSQETDVWENPNDNTGAMGTMKSSSSNIFIAPGFEYHIGDFEHFSPYVGAQVGIGFGGASVLNENVNGGAYQADYKYESNNPTFMLHSTVLAGFDWFFVENIYLGGEFGVGWISMKQKEGEETITTGGASVTTKTPEQRNSKYGNEAVGGLRIGWRF